MRRLVRYISFALALCIMTVFFTSEFISSENSERVSYLSADAAGVVITLDPGHGGSDPGTSSAFSNGGSHYESWYNLEIAKSAKERLEKYGITVYMTRTADAEISLSERVNIAVDNGSDALISIHNNSAAASSATGSVVCVPNENYRAEMSTKSSDIAHKILENLSESPGTRNRGLLKASYKGLYYPDGSAADYYAINRYAKQRGLNASMIVECAFCTNPSDVSLLEDEENRRKMGYSIADGIAEHYGLRMVEDKPAAPKYFAEITAVNEGGKVGFNDDYSLNRLTGLNDGSVIAFKIKAESGYKCSSITVGSENIEVYGNGTGAASYKVKISGADTKIKVTFEKILYSLGVYRVTTDFLNVRELPNADDSTGVLGQLNTNDRFTVTEIVNTHWGKVVFNGQTGYISIHLNYAEFVSDLIIESNDIVFDNNESVKWIKEDVPDGTSVDLYTDQTTEDVFMRVSSESSNTPYINFRFDKLGSMYADKYRYVLITAKTSAGGQAKMSFYTENNQSTPACSKIFQWKSDGLWYNYLIDLSGEEEWTGEIHKIVFEYSDSSGDGNILYFRNIRFLTAKPQEPSLRLSSSVMELGSSITVGYSGLEDYFGTNDNILPFISVYADNADFLGEPLFKKYLNESEGTFEFSADSTEGKIDEGNYVIRLGFDAKGTAGKSVNLQSVFLYSSDSKTLLKVEKPVRYVIGLYQVYIPRDNDGFALIRSNPSGYAVVKAAVPNNAYINITNISDVWGYVSYNGIEGWINIEDYLNFVSEHFDTSESSYVKKGDVNADGAVNVLDVADIVAYKRGNLNLTEKVLLESGIYFQSEAITVVTLVRIYNIIIR
ncbi:MAG: N-acetylmuramoyl-L-alanine amidase [Clostridia bacterium]|nr:N-acetylmuramoyl-L-alanine amidase [Clostridia bacterium]